MYTHGQRGQMMITDPNVPLLTQTPAVKTNAQLLPMFRPIEVVGLCATVIVQMTVTPAVLQLLYRPTPGSATGQTVLGTLTIPIASIIGIQVYKKINPFEANPGGQLIWELTSASTAGSVIPGIIEGATTEVPAAIPAMLASA